MTRKKVKVTTLGTAVLTGGRAMLTLKASKVPRNGITIVYSGDANNKASTVQHAKVDLNNSWIGTRSPLAVKWGDPRSGVVARRGFVRRRRPPMPGNPLTNQFPTTCWSRVVAARERVTPEARERLRGYARRTGIRFTPSSGARGVGPKRPSTLPRTISPGCWSARRSPRPTLCAAGSARSCWPTAPVSSPTTASGTMPPSAGAASRRCRSMLATPRAAICVSRRTSGLPSGSSSATGPWHCSMASSPGCAMSTNALAGVPFLKS